MLEVEKKNDFNVVNIAQLWSFDYSATQIKEILWMETCNVLSSGIISNNFTYLN